MYNPEQSEELKAAAEILRPRFHLVLNAERRVDEAMINSGMVEVPRIIEQPPISESPLAIANAGEIAVLKDYRDQNQVNVARSNVYALYPSDQNQVNVAGGNVHALYPEEVHTLYQEERHDQKAA